MRIALFSSNRTTIPPQPNVIAASSVLVGFLADRLIDRGHKVTLFAAQGSKSNATIVDLGLPPSTLDYAMVSKEWVKNMNLGMKMRYLSALYERAGEFDIIHLHTDPVYLGMPFAKLVKTPTVVTNHSPFLAEEMPLLRLYTDIPIVTISRFQASGAPELRHAGTVYNGIEVSEFPFSETGGSTFCFLGRLIPIKGIEMAIQSAREVGVSFTISGVGTNEYIESAILPQVSDDITFVGPLPRATKEFFSFFQHARGFIAPILWNEPFGLTFIESMACGTPVITFARGSAPEIVKDGVTGFIVNPSDDDIRGDWVIQSTGITGIKEAITRLRDMDDEIYQSMRKACRKLVEEKFSVERMVDEYIEVYKNIITQG